MIIKIENRIDKVVLYCVLLWIVGQILAIIFLRQYYNFNNDSLSYESLANQCAHDNTSYPSFRNLNDIYIQAPGFVNYLIVQIKSLGSVKYNVLLNMLMNIGILAEVYYLAKRFFGRRVAQYSVLLFCITLSNIFAPVFLLTEVPYLFFSLTGFCLCLSSRKVYLVIGSLCFAYAYTIRPLVLSFLLPALIYQFFALKSKTNPLLIVLVCVSCLFMYGEQNKKRMGFFVMSSTTGGVNLIQTANDQAGLMPNCKILSDSSSVAFIKGSQQYTFSQKDSIWKERAFSWIRENPQKYIGLCVKRPLTMYMEDTWSMPPLSQYDNWKVVEKSDDPIMRGRIRGLLLRIYSIPYYCVLILFLFALYRQRKSIISPKGVFLLVLALGTGGTCLFPVETRYHYPYVFVMIMWAACAIDALISSNRNKICERK